MNTFLLVICLIESVWLVGSFTMASFIYRGKLDHFMDVVADETSIHREGVVLIFTIMWPVLAIVYALSYLCVILSCWSRFMNWIRRKRD